MNQDSPFKKLRPHARWIPLAGVDNRDNEAKEALVERLLNTQDLFNVVRSYIDEKKAELDRGEQSLEDFQDSSWAYKQAFRAGKRAGFAEVENFLPDPKKHDPE